MKKRIYEDWIADRYASAMYNDDFGGLDEEDMETLRPWMKNHHVIEIRSGFEEEEMRLDPISGCSDWCCKCLVMELTK